MKEKSAKRKFLATTLGTLIVINTLALCGYSVIKLGNSSANLDSSEITLSVDDLDEKTENAIKERIISDISNGLEEDSFQDCNISSDVLLSLFGEVLEENPEFFYLNADNCSVSCSGNYFMETGIKWAKKLKIFYPDDVQQKIDYVNKITDEIIAGIDDSMNDFDKALYVHDYLALNYSYDERIHSDDESIRNQAVGSMYDFFQQKTGVCQAYANTYRYIMKYKLGINTENVRSSSMCHAWNVVNIDGNWYHVDVTWDDPEPDRIGCVNHNYFLLSDEAMSQSNHYDWYYERTSNDISCNDSTYDDYWWKDISAQIFRINGSWCSVDENGQFVSRNINGEIVDSSQASFSIERDKWYSWKSDTAYWLGNYTTLIKYGNVFFYNTTENVYVIDMDGSNKRLVASFPKSEHDGYQIFGMGINENGELYVSLQNNPQDTTDANGNKVPMDKQIIVVGNPESLSGTAVDNSSSNSSENTAFESWDDISSALEENKSVEITFDEPSDNNTPVELPASVVENAKGKDVDIVVNVGSYQWTINGLNVSDDKQIADVNLGVKENEGIVPDDITNKYVDEQQTVEVDLEHEGQFGYTANLRIYTGSEYAGKMASVLHYDTDNARLAYQETVPVDENGYAVLNLQHASSYMVVIDDKAVGLPGDIDNDGKSTIIDYAQLKKYLISSSTDDSSLKLVNADMDGDNEITIRDAVLFSRELVK